MSRISNNKRNTSKRRAFNNRKSKKISHYFGGKPTINKNSYTYFIIGHGIMTSEFLSPIQIPVNGSIITTTDIGISTNTSIAEEIVKYYTNNNRLFQAKDTSKNLTDQSKTFIENTLNPLIDKDTPLNIRNHIKSATVNNISITFESHNKPNEEFLGVMRYNHTTRKLEHFNINLLKAMEKQLDDEQSENLSLKHLLHYLFDTPIDQQIIFDNHVTIIAIMCRVFDDELKANPDRQEFARRRSALSDTVASDHQIMPIPEMQASVMRPLNDDYKWLSVDTKVLLKNGYIGTIKDLYLNSVKFNIEMIIPKIRIKGLNSRPELNGHNASISGDLQLDSKKNERWPVWVDRSRNNLMLKTENLDVSFIKIREDIHREYIVDIIDNSIHAQPQPPAIPQAQSAPIPNPAIKPNPPVIPQHQAIQQAQVAQTRRGIDYSKWDKFDE
jgi:hypothetical protein